MSASEYQRGQCPSLPLGTGWNEGEPQNDICAERGSRRCSAKSRRRLESYQSPISLFLNNSVSFLHVPCRSKVTSWLRCPTSSGRLLGISIRTSYVSSLFFCSSFYGLLDILSGTELNNGQREIGLGFLALILSGRH
jgi:hypothetical protein